MKKLGKKVSFLTKILLVVGLLISNLSSLTAVFASEITEMDKKSVDMKKKGIDFEVEDNRSEIKGKVKENAKKKVGVVKKTKKSDVDLEQTIALDTVKILREGKSKKPTEEEKRSEISTKVGGKKTKSTSNNSDDVKKIKSRKLRIEDYNMEEKKMIRNKKM